MNEIELKSGKQYLVFHTDDSNMAKFQTSEIMEWRGASFHDENGKVYFIGSVAYKREAYENEKIIVPKNKELDIEKRQNERRNLKRR